MARLDCHFSASLAREQLEDYVREVRIDVLEHSNEFLDEHLIGRVNLNQVLWSEAELDSVRLFDICDNDSQGLYEVYRILTNKTGRFRRSLAIHDPVEQMLFVYRFVVHPDFAPYQRSVLEAVLTLFGCASLAVMWMGESEFTEGELASLGFRKIAGEALIYRHSALRTTFSDEFPRGQNVDVFATAEHEAWVLEQVGVKTGDG